MGNLSYITRPLLGSVSPDFLYETFPPVPARSSYLRVAHKYSHPLGSLFIWQNTEVLSSPFSFLAPFASKELSRSSQSFLSPTVNLPQCLRDLMVVVRKLVCSRTGRVPIGKPETQDEFSILAIFLACMAGFLFFLGLCMGDTDSDWISSTVVCYICFLRSTLPSRQPQCWVVPSLSHHNISSLIPVYFLGFVSPGDVCPASSEHTLSPWGYEFLFLSYTPLVGENGSWRRMGSFYLRWLPSYYRHVRLTAAVGNSRSHGSWQMFVSNLPALGWFFQFVRQFEGGKMLTLVAGSYKVFDPVCESFLAEIPCYYLNRFFMSEEPCYYRVVTAFGYLGLKGLVFEDVQSILEV